MFSNNGNRFEQTKEFEKIAEQLHKLQYKHRTLKSDFAKDPDSNGGRKYQVIGGLLEQINKKISNFNESTDGDEESKKRLCHEIRVLIYQEMENNADVLRAQRYQTGQYETSAKIAVTAGAFAMLFFAPLSWGGAALAAAGVKYAGDKAIEPFEDHPGRNTKSEDILEALDNACFRIIKSST